MEGSNAKDTTEPNMESPGKTAIEGERNAKEAQADSGESTESQASPIVSSFGTSGDSLLPKVLWTCVVFYAHACMALMFGAIGPSFLDLLEILDTTVETGSFIFTAQSLGGMSGGLASAWFYTKFRNERVLTVGLLCSGLLNIALPFCPTLWLLCIIIGLRGTAIFLCFTGCALICIETWRRHEGSPILQALHCAYSVGGVIAPFIMSGFLREQGCETGVTMKNQTVSVENFTLHDATTITDNNGCDSPSRVHIGFLIIGLITLVNFVFSFLVMFFTKSPSVREPNSQVTQEETKYVVEEESESLNRVTKFAFIAIIVVYFMMIVAIETLFQNYLATFVIKYLNWTKAAASTATSAFWGAFACGRFLGIFAAKLLTPWRIIAIDFLLLSVATVTLALAVDSHAMVLWICASGSGLFVSGLYAAGCSFVDEKIFNITGKIYSIFLISETSGSMIYPLILGTLIDNFTPLWFLYLAVIIAVICDLDFIVITLMERRWGKQSRKRKMVEQN